MRLDDILNEDGTLGNILTLQREVREECQKVCLDVPAPVNGFDNKRAETVLAELAIDDFEPVDSLRWLVDYFFSCQVPFPRGLILNGNDREHYNRVIRTTGDVEGVNRFLLIEQNPMVLKALARFVNEYNLLVGESPLTLEREEFDKDVSERGLDLYLQQKAFSRRIIEENLWREGRGVVLELARGERNKDMARDEKERNFTRVRNYEKGAARSVARFKREQVREYLRDCPELEYYYDVPEPVKNEFLQSLKKAYIIKAFQNGFQKLDDVFVGFDLELYLSSNGLCLNDGALALVRREIDTLYEDALAHCGNEIDYQNLFLLLLGELENDMYKKRPRPVFISGNNFGMEKWMTIADLHKRFYLGRDSWRRRLRNGQLRGVKEAIGKYVAVPEAGRWRVNPGSVDEFTSRYNDDGRLLIARNLEHLSRILNDDGCYTLPEAAKLDGMPSLDALRRIVKENGAGYVALVGAPCKGRDKYGKEKTTIAVRERRILAGDDIGVMRGY